MKNAKNAEMKGYFGQYKQDQEMKQKQNSLNAQNANTLGDEYR
jgi:hypothetical protein